MIFEDFSGDENNHPWLSKLIRNHQKWFSEAQGSFPNDPWSILRFSIFSWFSRLFGSKKRCSFKKNSYPQNIRSHETLHAPRCYQKLQRIWGRSEKPVKIPEFLRGNSGRNFPCWSMCGGAVNRQPGYRARNLQSRGWTRTAKTKKKYKEEGKQQNKTERKLTN